MEKMLNKKEVAVMFGITVAGVNKWIQERKIPYVKLPGAKGGVRFNPSSLDQFIKNRTVSRKASI